MANNIKTPPWYGGGLGPFMQPGMELGTIFYVNYGGDDTNDGLSPEAPFETLTAAIAACTDDRHDVIVVLNWWLNEACPIVVNKRMITIIGAPSGSLAQPAIQIAATGDTQVFDIAERDVAIHNFILDAGASRGCVEFQAGIGFVRIGLYNLYFRSALHGVWAEGVNQPAEQLTVANCYFEGSLTGDGIRYTSNGPFALFQNNVFDTMPGIGINVNGAAGAGRILDNRINLPSNTQGKGITLSNACVRWFVDGNSANYGVTTMGANPYEDTSAAVNTWGTNWNGSDEVDPA